MTKDRSEYGEITGHVCDPVLTVVIGSLNDDPDIYTSVINRALEAIPVTDGTVNEST